MKKHYTAAGPLRLRVPADNYYDIFRNMESASRRNLDTFCELLDYTYEIEKEHEEEEKGDPE